MPTRLPGNCCSLSPRGSGGFGPSGPAVRATGGSVAFAASGRAFAVVRHQVDLSGRRRSLAFHGRLAGRGLPVGPASRRDRHGRCVLQRGRTHSPEFRNTRRAVLAEHAAKPVRTNRGGTASVVARRRADGQPIAGTGHRGAAPRRCAPERTTQGIAGRAHGDQAPSRHAGNAKRRRTDSLQRRQPGAAVIIFWRGL